MKGLYFYKLVSPYQEDVTKDCKLTVNEIDHNFITLKDVDVKDAHFEENDKILVIERNDGDTINVDLSSMVDGITTNLDIDYDRVAGTITITHNDKRAVIDGLITQDNISSEILTEVISDSSLQGKGNDGSPLGVSPVEKTGSYKPVIRLVDITNGEFMPKPQHLIKGDRYLTLENVSDYGYLYDFRGVKKINEDLCHGWRVPTKEDWDNMLNAIEPCDEYRNHNSIIGNQVLGKLAGKLLKSRDKWDESDACISLSGLGDECPLTTGIEPDFDVDDCDVADIGSDECKKSRYPKPKRVNPNGVDAYNMTILPPGYGDGCQVMDYFGKRGAYWTSTMSHVTDVYVKRFDYNKSGVVQSIEAPQALFSLRLVKDYNGSNHHDVEFINGIDYPTRLMPSLNTEHGYAIWTAVNVAFTNNRYQPVKPNNGMGLTYRKAYYINEWDGFNWVKKEMKEGETIVLIKGLDGDKNIEYRIIDGKLVSVAKVIYDKIVEEFKPDIDRIDKELDDLRDRMDSVEDRVDSLESSTSDTNAKLEQEIADRIKGDEQLWDGLNKEISAREEVDTQLWSAINNEAAAREQVDTQLWEAINTETVNREEVDTQLWSAINNESRIREEEDKKIYQTIENESIARQDVEKQLWSAINNEAAAREQVDTQLWEAINTETVNREEVDTQLWSAINNEIERAKGEEARIEAKLDDEIERSTEKDIYLEGRLISPEGSVFDCANGTLTLETDNPVNKITIKLTGNYGTF